MARSFVGVWIVGPIVGGVIMLTSIIVIIVLRCRARRLAQLGMQNGTFVGTTIAVAAPGDIQFKNNNFQQYPNNMGMEATSWGLNNQNQAYGNQGLGNQGFNNQVFNAGGGMGNNAFNNNVAYDPLNPNNGIEQGYTKNF